MSKSRELAIHIVDLADHIGPCEARRTFGGYGVFHLGLIFDLAVDRSLYPRADDGNRGGFEAAGREAFTCLKQGKRCRLSYYQLSGEFFDRPAACPGWARRAFGAAPRNPARKRTRKP